MNTPCEVKNKNNDHKIEFRTKSMITKRGKEKNTPQNEVKNIKNYHKTE